MAMSGMPGCDGCEHFKEVHLDEKKGGKHPYRRYCALGNFNLDTSCYAPRKTSHNKLVYEQQYMGQDFTEFGRPVRCPLKSAEERKSDTEYMKEQR